MGSLFTKNFKRREVITDSYFGGKEAFIRFHHQTVQPVVTDMFGD